MTERFESVVRTLYGHNIWENYSPTVAEDAQGWNGDHPALNQLVAMNDNQVVIDVGVWKGMSTLAMAASMKKAGVNGCVISVDTFLGSQEHWTTGDDGLFARHNGMPNLYQIFMSNVCHFGLTDYVVPLPQTSVSAAAIMKRLGVSATVVHIDAAHEYEEVLRDAQEYWDLLVPGGYLVGDDYHVTWPGVVQAAGEFSAAKNAPLTIYAPKWILQKPGI